MQLTCQIPIIKYLIFLSLIILVSCNSSNNDTNKEMGYFESIHNAEEKNIDLMIEESKIDSVKVSNY